jgi:aspartate beta-hydroxylase
MTLSDRTVAVVQHLYARGLATTAILDPSSFFPGAHAFQSRWPELRQEALQVAEHLLSVPRFHDLLPNQAAISANDDRDWRMFVLKAYGIPVSRHLRQCPVLAKLLAHDDAVLSAAFSFLAPGKHIPEHCGPFRGIVRFHLSLSAAPDDTGQPGTVLRIDGRDHRLADGEMLLWDDTFRHEVWNRTSQLRIALLLDVRREHMPTALRLLSAILVAGIASGFRWQLAMGKSLSIG